MEEKNTRDLIMQEALILFSNKGYAAVSMRDIAGAVGIQVSSIYYHFSSKQDLFNALIEKAKDIKQGLQAGFMSALGKVEFVEREAFIQAGLFFISGYIQNPQIAPLLQVLECERFHNEQANEAWLDLLILAPMEHESAVFRALDNRGVLKESNIDVLVAEYQSAILLAYFTGNMEMLRKQLDVFYQRTICTI